MSEDLEHQKKIDDLITAAAQRIVEVTLNVYSRDPHRFSARPCATCRTISDILKEDWGCKAMAARRKP